MLALIGVIAVIGLFAGPAFMMGAAVGRWWGGMLGWPLSIAGLFWVLAVNVPRESHFFFFIPVVLAAIAPFALIGAVWAVLALREGRLSGSPVLGPAARKRALWVGLGVCAVDGLCVLLNSIFGK